MLAARIENENDNPNETQRTASVSATGARQMHAAGVLTRLAAERAGATSLLMILLLLFLQKQSLVHLLLFLQKQSLVRQRVRAASRAAEHGGWNARAARAGSCRLHCRAEARGSHLQSHARACQRPGVHCRQPRCMRESEF